MVDFEHILGLHQATFQHTLNQANLIGGVDLIATSPPYADARTYGMDCSFTDKDYQDLAHSLWDGLKPGGWALINLDAPVRDWVGDGRGTERGLHPDRFKLYAHDVVGFRLPDRLAFGRQGLPGEYSGRFRNDWEPLIWLQKPGGDGYFDRLVLATASISDYSRTVAHQRTSDGSLRLRKATGAAADAGIKHRGTLWWYGMTGSGQTGAPDIEDARHPARWPYKLAMDIVLCFSPPGGIVCDPFLGGGTTMIAALEAGRRFIGGDLGVRSEDQKPWIDVAREVARNRSDLPYEPKDPEESHSIVDLFYDFSS